MTVGKLAWSLALGLFQGGGLGYSPDYVNQHSFGQRASFLQ